MEPLLSIQDLSVSFVAGLQTTTAVKNISVDVRRGEVMALVGESGSGKSVTSLSVLRLLPSPPARYSSGRILFKEGTGASVDLLKLSLPDLQQLRGNSIGIIFQEPMTSLNPVMKCGRQVMEALLQHKKLTAAAAKKATIDWLAKVKLPRPDDIFHRYPHQLSGGQKQRIMIAMALCCSPSLLICDEPTTALDVTVQKSVLQLIKELQREQNLGVIFITHDLGVVAQIADRVAIMQQGEIVEQGTTKEIFVKAQHPYTKALIACRPALHPKGEKLPTVASFLNEEEKTAQKTPRNGLISGAEEKPAIVLKAEGLSVQFPTKTSFLGRTLSRATAVDDISFEIYKGETVGLVGESGCGKTTLGRTLLRLQKPASGKIIFGSRDITHLSGRELKSFRKEVQLVFQDPYSSLNPRLTVGAALTEPLYLFHPEGSKRERAKRVAQLLEQVNLSPAMTSRYPHQFSGGQRQRIVIARALALDPTFLVCDESVSALDVSVQAQVLNLLNDLKKELGLTLLFISHDLSVVRYMSDRILVMNRGKIIESGSAEQVYDHPQSDYTKRLLAAIPRITV